MEIRLLRAASLQTTLYVRQELDVVPHRGTTDPIVSGI